MKQPKLRFKANDGNQYPEWEEKRLEEVAVRITRKNKDNCTDIPLTISSLDGLIDQRDFFNKIVASKDMSGYYLLKRGEFAYNKSYSKGFDFGSIKRLNLYDEGALSTLYICFALNNNEDSDFYQKYFDSLSWYPELQKICAEGARNHGLLNVSTNDFFQLKLHVPKSKEEQQEIASLFTELDNLIQSAQKELDGYRELKQGMLQKMFPKKGEKVPEIRFPEFTDNWEQCKLGKCAEFNPKSELPDIFEYVDLESVVGTDILSHRTESKSSAPSRAQRLAQKGDVFYQTVRPYQKNNCIFEKDDNNWVFSTGYAQLRPVNNGYFLLTLLQNEDFVKRVLDRCTGTSYPAINSNDLADIDVNIPSDNKEQQKIGAYFKNLDNLIILQQRELDGYKELKKGLLQQMFC